jgi:prepilin-type N-terminal cleavage/methylation domain-containing protein
LKNKQGFTIIELIIVILIVATLAAFALPKLRDVLEKNRAKEAITYLSNIQLLEDEYFKTHGVYANNLDLAAPKYFKVGEIIVTENLWTMTLTRNDLHNAYGAYTVVFTPEGFDSTNSTIYELTSIRPSLDE